VGDVGGKGSRTVDPTYGGASMAPSFKLVSAVLGVSKREPHKDWTARQTMEPVMNARMREGMPKRSCDDGRTWGSCWEGEVVGSNASRSPSSGVYSSPASTSCFLGMVVASKRLNVGSDV